MKSLYVYLLLGGAGIITAAAIIKRKPSRIPQTIATSPTVLPSPKAYLPAAGDVVATVAARFGTTPKALSAANAVPALTALSPTKPIKLPANVADLGARAKAQGKAS